MFFEKYLLKKQILFILEQVRSKHVWRMEKRTFNELSIKNIVKVYIKYSLFETAYFGKKQEHFCET